MRQSFSFIVLVLLVEAMLVFSAKAQNSNIVSGNFENASFSQFVEKMEEQTGYHFYYDSSQVDSLKVNIKADGLTLNKALDMLFSNSGFYYAIDAYNNVIITKRIAITTTIPADFFTPQKEVADTPVESPVFNEKDEIKRKDKIASAENKVVEIGKKTDLSKPEKAIIAGYIRDAKNGEAVIGAVVYVEDSPIEVVTDQFGYFALSLPTGKHILKVTSIGMKEAKREIMLYSDGKLNVELRDDVPTLKSVVVQSEKRSNIRSLQMGVEKLNIKTIKKIPVLMGETDVLRVVLTLPGVTSVGEASTGFNVRGGSADQNLVLYNDATIYNPAHLFGFFSAFNPDVIKGVELYKSSVPEKYGGRISSVLDVTTREGNNKKWTGTGGIGLLTSKFTIEGPLAKEKTSIILGGRTTYSNWILKRINNKDYNNSSASFYDLDLHLNHTINSKNNLYFSGYLSKDNFRLNNDTTYNYGNRNVVIKWKHIFNNRLYATFSTGIDHYRYSIEGEHATVNSYELGYKINQLNFKTDFSYAYNNRHSFNFGVNTIRYRIDPGSLRPKGSQSLVVPDIVALEQAQESALYLGDKITLSPKLSLNAGLRYSMFNYLGPQKVFEYIKGLPREVTTISDTANYPGGKVIKTYHGPEVRLALRYILSDNASIKVSFNTMRQYIHLLSNTVSISPTDIWKLSDANIKPQLGEQYSLGFYQNFRSNTIETSIEVYYKNLKNYLDYKSGAFLILNHHIETDVINTQGQAYGAEFLIRKLSGKLNGWATYTYSRTKLKMNDPIAGQIINGGNYYPANYDKPHSVNFIGNYSFSHRYSISINTVYSTGRPITLPIAIFDYAGAQRVYYSDRNQYRVPNYFRMDFSMNIEGNHRIKKLTHNSWSIGVYNLTARKNPYSIYFIQENGLVKGYKLSVIGTAIPYITYNFKF